MNESYRKVMGQRLREFRESRGLSRYRVAKNGEMPIHRVTDVENGETNYTIDTFLSYIRGCDLYMYFAEKDPDRLLEHDFGDFVKKLRK